MDFTILWNSHWLIVVHACAAMAALVFGALQLVLPKGTNSHRQTGYVWVTLILIVSFTSFGIFGIRLIGPFSPIHLLSILTIHTVITAIISVRDGDINQHKRSMSLLYMYLGLAGAFTLYPERLMHQVMFG